MGTITHVATQDPVAALTFDDGPDPDFTPRLIEVLARHQAQATFFMLGHNVREHPDLVKQVAEGGHAIANHSWDHPSFPLLTGGTRRRQIRDCADAIAPYGGLRLFRPPYGHQTVASRRDAFLLGYSVVMGDAVAEDWWPREAAWMADRLVNRIKPGSILVLHDRIHRSVQDAPQYDRQPMITAVDMTLTRLSDRIRFVTIPELLKHGEPVRSYYFSTPPPEMVARLREHPLLQQRPHGSQTAPF